MADRGRLFYDSNGKLRQVDPAFVINGEPTESDLEPVEFIDIRVDNTTVVVNLSSNYSYLTADGWDTIPLNSEQIDLLNEYDTTAFQFTPQETGWYFVSISARFSFNSTGDHIGIRIRDTTGGMNVLSDETEQSGVTPRNVSNTSLVELLSTGTYEVQVINTDNNDTILDRDDQTFLSVRSAFQ